MPSVQIKDVPEETHAVLRRRAAMAHQSLQEYLRGRLVEEAATPTLDEVLDRAGGRAGGSATLQDAVTRDDAAYIALAEVLGTTLLTADRRLTHAPGLRCDVETLG